MLEEMARKINRVMEYKMFIKLLVAFLFALAVAKIYFYRQNTEIESFKSSMEQIIPARFWKTDSEDINLDVKPDNQHIKTQKEESTIQLTTPPPKPKVKTTVTAPIKKKVDPLRVVHLDLKGAAPKVSYFQQFFPLISSLGANGILVEYEDMFPYEGGLDILRSPLAYSGDDIEEIKRLARLYNLELIPLVQVFGHLEFVLKHEQFFSLREIDNYPNSLNPLRPGSFKLVKEMLSQVLKKHPEAKWFHIGADEVYGLGEGNDTKKWLKQHKGNVGQLFLNHVTKVCQFLAKQRPGIKPIFWEDMLRQLNATLVKESGMAHLASPMIWKYTPNMNVEQIGQLLFNYQQAGFKSVWFASAFKGASGIDQRWTPINHHLQNHLAWLKVMGSMSNLRSIKLDGIVLTGWQRYDHFTVLCELLPVAIPSLAICLETLKHGSFSRLAEKEVEKHLGCTVDLEANVCKGYGTFPGSEIYNMVKKIHGELKRSTEKVLENYHLRGYFTSYQRKYNFANPRFIGYFKDILIKTLTEWDSFMKKFRHEMMIVYFSDTVEEWIEENVNKYMDKLYSLAKDLERIVKLKARPKSIGVHQAANRTDVKSIQPTSS